jgi:hypothetical protein
MADFGLLVGSGAPVRGRETNAAAVFGEAVERWTRLQTDGRIESWEAVFLEPHGGELAGFSVIRGERDDIARLRLSDEVLRLNIRAGHIIERYGIIGAELGSRIQSSMQDRVGNAQELS